MYFPTKVLFKFKVNMKTFIIISNYLIICSLICSYCHSRPTVHNDQLARERGREREYSKRVLAVLTVWSKEETCKAHKGRDLTREWERKAHSLNSHRDDRQSIPRVSNTRRHICPQADRRVPPSRIGSAAVSAAGSDWSRYDPQLTLASSPPCLGYNSAHCGGHSQVIVVVLAPPPTGVPIDERTESWQFATLVYAILEILLNWQRIEKRLTDIELSNDQLKNKQAEKRREEEKQKRNEDSSKARAGQLILQIIIDTAHNMEGN